MTSSVQILRRDGWLQALAGKDDKLVVLEFMSPRSEPCKFMKAKLDSVANEKKDKAYFYALDIDEFKQLAERLGVEALPTFVLVNKYYVKGRVVGVDKDELKKAIDEKYSELNA